MAKQKGVGVEDVAASGQYWSDVIRSSSIFQNVLDFIMHNTYDINHIYYINLLLLKA